MVARQPLVSHPSRRARLADQLVEPVEALLVSGRENIRYLSGFTGSAGVLLVLGSGEAILATDGRYLIQAAEQAPDVECIESRTPLSAALAHSRALGLATVGIEAAHLTLAVGQRLRAEAAGDLGLVETSGLVESLRAVKDEGELAALRRACEITDLAFTSVVLALRPGVTEREVADRLFLAMRAAGAEAAAFDSIVAFGSNAAIPHHEPTDRPLERGDLVKTDFGARFAGYHADMTRTVVAGPAAQWQRDVHSEVGRIQEAGVAAALAGASPVDLDRAASSAIESAGYRTFHGLGHGVGLQIHEDPFLTASSTAGPIEPGMVVTVEPGIYLEGRGGVRIEDTLAVTTSGPEVLTRSSRELIEI